MPLLGNGLLPHIGVSGLTIVPVPTGFAFEPSIEIRRSGNAISVGNYDVAADDRVPSGGVTYYVNPTTGSDSNSGLTDLLPLKNIHTAFGKADVSDIVLAPDVYDRVNGGWKGLYNAKSIAVRSDGTGAVYVGTMQRFSSWTQDPTHTNCYSVSRSATVRVLDSTQVDANGDVLELSTAASLADCNTTANSRFISGSTVYVNVGRVPSTEIWVVVGEGNCRSRGDIIVYLEGITFVGGSDGAVFIENSAAGQSSVLLMKDCNTLYSQTNGVTVKGADSVFQNCTAVQNDADGFNYHAFNTVECHAVEVACTGRHNGTRDGVDGNDQGSSIHESGAIVRINGSYHNNGGGNTADIDTSETWMLGCELYESEGDPSNDYNASGVSLWLDTCNLHDSGTDIVGDAYTHNVTYSTITGTATPY